MHSIICIKCFVKRHRTYIPTHNRLIQCIVTKQFFVRFWMLLYNYNIWCHLVLLTSITHLSWHCQIACTLSKLCSLGQRLGNLFTLYKQVYLHGFKDYCTGQCFQNSSPLYRNASFSRSFSSFRGLDV